MFKQYKYLLTLKALFEVEVRIIEFLRAHEGSITAIHLRILGLLGAGALIEKRMAEGGEMK